MRWGKYVVYDETSPSCLRWKIDIPRSKYTPLSYPSKLAGEVAGTQEECYYRLYVKPEQELAHRVVWMLFNGDIPDGLDVDHIDGNNLNNKVNNLRLVTRKLNLRNKRKLDANSSGVTGVSKATNKSGVVGWRARWRGLDGKEYSKTFTFYACGSAAFQMAHAARDKAIAELNAKGAGYTERHGT